MATFTIDFPIEVFATVQIEAKNYNEARSIAERLSESRAFFDEVLLDRWNGADWLPENMGDPETTDAVYGLYKLALNDQARCLCDFA